MITTVGTAVAGLRDLGKLAPVLKRLGEKHTKMGKGIGAPHYQLIGEQLIVTLRQGLGEEFTPEVEAAWKAIYVILANTMQQL